MADGQVVPARVASRLIRPGAFKRVHFQFVSGGATALVRTPKVNAQVTLRRLAVRGAEVLLELDAENGDAIISGAE